jgi:hypothetical protein
LLERLATAEREVERSKLKKKRNQLAQVSLHRRSSTIRRPSELVISSTKFVQLPFTLSRLGRAVREL